MKRMRKIMLILLVVFTANLGFAQEESMTSKVPKNDAKPAIPLNSVKLNKGSKANGEFWFSYAEGLNAYWGTDFRGTTVHMLSDTIATFNYDEGPGRPQFLGIGQTFNFNSSVWEEFYRDLSGEGPIPLIKESGSYSIDSVALTYGYQRGTNVPDTIVDTLVFSVAAFNKADNTLYSLFPRPSEAWFLQPTIPYDKENACIDNSASDKVYTVKVPLTTADGMEEGMVITRTFPVEGFQNLTDHKTVFVSMNFKTGKKERNIDDLLGEDISMFRFTFYDDPRSAYSTHGSQELLNEKDVSMNIMDLCLQEGWVMSGIFVSNSVWDGSIMRPLLGIHTTCNDCAFVGVKEMEKKNVTVYPNPATQQFTVSLDDAGKARIELYNLMGQLVLNQESQSETVSVNVNHLNNGIYMLKVTQNGKVYTSKVIVK